MATIPDGLTKAHVKRAIERLATGEPHPFGRSTKFDLVFQDLRYPPKAVLGLAVGELTGRPLGPDDFSGGEESRCHTILKGLDFKIVPKAGATAGVDRSSPVAAKTVLDRLLAHARAESRTAVLRFLAASIEESSAVANDRWAVKLDAGHVRFNVGKTESVVLWPSSISVLVKSNATLAGTTLSRPYPSAGGSRLRHVPYDVAARVLPSLVVSHEAAKRLARHHPCTRAIMDAHSPGFVAFLWDKLAMPGPQPVPSHYGQNRRPLSARERRAALIADKKVIELPDLAQTEKQVVIKQRLAQRLFRDRLKAADCRCRVTGVGDAEHLRASHIKPWAKCNDTERQDPANGLLLAPHVDHLFDAGYISFEDDGTVLVSRHLDKAVLEAWGLEPRKIKGVKFSKEQARYLAYHRKYVFEK